MRRLLVLRPEPGASETAVRAVAAGWSPVMLPLFETRARPWEPPAPDRFDAIMITSAAAIRHGGPALADYRALPVLAVGDATATAAREAGFADVRAGDGDAEALLRLAREAGLMRLLQLAGREHRALDLPGIEVVRAIVYAADAIDAAGIALPSPGSIDVALIHSARAGARLAELATTEWKCAARIAAISAAVAEAAGPGWARVAVAARPTDAALLAAAATLCDQAASGE